MYFKVQDWSETTFLCVNYLGWPCYFRMILLGLWWIVWQLYYFLWVLRWVFFISSACFILAASFLNSYELNWWTSVVQLLRGRFGWCLLRFFGVSVWLSHICLFLFEVFFSILTLSLSQFVLSLSRSLYWYYTLQQQDLQWSNIYDKLIRMLKQIV